MKTDTKHPFNQARYLPLTAMKTEAEAAAAIAKLVDEHMAEEELAGPEARAAVEAVELNNIAVFFSMNEPREFARIEKLFQLDHLYYSTGAA